MSSFLASLSRSLEEQKLAAQKSAESPPTPTVDVGAATARPPGPPTALTVSSPASFNSTPSPTPSSLSHALAGSSPVPPPSYPMSSLSSLPSVSSTPISAVSSPPPPRSATVKQHHRRASSHKAPSPSHLDPSALPFEAMVELEDDSTRMPALKPEELEAESKAHHHRLALDRPAFIERRRAEEERRKAVRSSRLRRWPYVDCRNVAQCREEKESERLALEQPREEEAKRQSEEAVSSVDGQRAEEERKEGAAPQPSSAVDRTAPAAAAEAGSSKVDDAKEAKEEAKDDLNLSVDGDGEETEDDGESISEAQAGGDWDSAQDGQWRSHKKRAQAMGWQKKSKKRRTASSSPAPISAYKPPPLSLSAPSFPAPIHHSFGHFTPTLLLGNRVHFFDLQTRLPRDGDLLEYSASKAAYLVRLDPTGEEAEKGLKEAALMRWLKVEEQEVWEYIDVAWCRHPDRGGVKSWWPCDVVRVYRGGRLVEPHRLHKDRGRPKDAEETEDEEEEDDSQRPSAIVHLLGLAEDTRLFALGDDAVMTWSEGLSQGYHTRPTKAISQALKDGQWTFHFHLQKWVNLEHERRRRNAEAARSRAGQDWIGRRVAVLWDDDAKWSVDHDPTLSAAVPSQFHIVASLGTDHRPLLCADVGTRAALRSGMCSPTASVSSTTTRRWSGSTCRRTTWRTTRRSCRSTCSRTRSTTPSSWTATAPTTSTTASSATLRSGRPSSDPLLPPAQLPTRRTWWPTPRWTRSAPTAGPAGWWTTCTCWPPT